MKKIFCINCGNSVLFDLSIPKFCTSCGQSPSVVSAEKIPPKKPLIHGISRIDEVVDDYEEDSDEELSHIINNISIADFETDGSISHYNKHSFESLAKQSPDSGGGRRKNGGVKVGSELIDEIDKHCLSLQRKSIDDRSSE